MSTLERTQIETFEVPKTREKMVYDKIHDRHSVCHPKIDTRAYFKDIVVPAAFAPLTRNG